VERWCAGIELQLAAELVDEQECADVPNAALHRLEPDQLGVELVEHLRHLRFGERSLETELGHCIHARRPRV
jgi:hypothetical protein